MGVASLSVRNWKRWASLWTAPCRSKIISAISYARAIITSVATHTPSSLTRRRQHYGLQHRRYPHRLLQLTSLRRGREVTRQTAACAEQTRTRRARCRSTWAPQHWPTLAAGPQSYHIQDIYHVLSGSADRGAILLERRAPAISSCPNHAVRGPQPTDWTCFKDQDCGSTLLVCWFEGVEHSATNDQNLKQFSDLQDTTQDALLHWRFWQSLAGSSTRAPDYLRGQQS